MCVGGGGGGGYLHINATCFAYLFSSFVCLRLLFLSFVLAGWWRRGGYMDGRDGAAWFQPLKLDAVLSLHAHRPVPLWQNQFIGAEETSGTPLLNPTETF